jgi:hypothetical protein
VTIKHAIHRRKINGRSPCSNFLRWNWFPFLRHLLSSYIFSMCRGRDLPIARGEGGAKSYASKNWNSSPCLVPCYSFFRTYVKGLVAYPMHSLCLYDNFIQIVQNSLFQQNKFLFPLRSTDSTPFWGLLYRSTGHNFNGLYFNKNCLKGMFFLFRLYLAKLLIIVEQIVFPAKQNCPRTN